MMLSLLLDAITQEVFGQDEIDVGVGSDVGAGDGGVGEGTDLPSKDQTGSTSPASQSPEAIANIVYYCVCIDPKI